MKEISLTRGRVALVDDEDYEWLMQWKWYADKKGYARRKVSLDPPGAVGRVNGVRRPCRYKAEFIHRLVANAPDGVQVDHINGDKADNRRENLRLATNAENQRNVEMRKNNTSGFKGVNWHKGSRRWDARIMVDGKSLYLGGFQTAEEASAAYVAASKRLHGDFSPYQRKDPSVFDGSSSCL